MQQKKIIIIAGPNGAGKTTFAREFLPYDADCPIFVNADLIAASLEPLRPEAAAIKASRMMLQQIDEHAARGDNFAYETTLSGRAYLRMIREWRQDGYVVKLLFLALATLEEAIGRVAERVAQGGHHVADEVVRRRFVAGLSNFKTLYRFEVDAWRWYDNGGDVPILIDEGENV